MTTYEIPLSPQPQTFGITIAGTPYRMRFLYHNVDQGGWAMDLMDAASNPIVCGISLVTGADLLAQYEYLGVGASIYVQSDGDPSAAPTFTNLGVGSHVYLLTA